MGVESQETRGIPRNRKCGNCRFYEPAPLWRKGWCRNPKLYPPHANHLVDANTIDCEGGFRSRIYWEPVMSSQVAPPVPAETPPFVPANVTPLTQAAPANYAPVQPTGPLSSGPVAQPIGPSPEAYHNPVRPMEPPASPVYKHPLADRNFGPKPAGDTIRPVNTNPAPIIARSTPPTQSQEPYAVPGPGPTNNRPPLTPPPPGGGGGSEPPDSNYQSNYQSYAPRSNRSYAPQEPAPEPAPRKYPGQDQPQPFITPPPQGYGSSQAYGDTAEYADPAAYRERENGPVYPDQPPAPTRPYQQQQPTQPLYSQPQSPMQSKYMSEQAMPPKNYSDTPPGNYPPPENNDYPTQPANYSSQSQYGTEKEPLKIQEALPVNPRPRPLEPKRPLQPTPGRFRPVNEDQPAANIAPSQDWRATLREKAPFTQNWNLERITMNRQTILPWAIGGVLVLILLIVLVANMGKKNEPANPTVPGSTTSAAVSPGSQTTAPATTSAAATTAPATSTTPPVKTALVKGTGSTLNMRETASLKGSVVTTVKDGEKVTVKDGPKDAEGYSWYQIEYGGKTGWAVKDYLEIQP